MIQKLINDLHLMASQGETPDGDGITVNVQLWAEQWIARLGADTTLRDAERYRWLRKYYGSVDFEPADHDGMDLVFSVPQGEVSADCDKTIDGLMQGANT